jgi:hypothetical protein
MDNDFDILQQKWKAANCSANDAAHEGMIDQIRSHRSSKLTREIERTYRVPMIVGLFLPILSVTLVRELHFGLMLCLCYGLFGWIMAGFSYYMIRILRKCDYTQMTVRHAVYAVNSMFKSHVIILIFGWVLCLPLLIWLFAEFAHQDVYVLYGAIAGLIIGLPIGIRREMKIYRHFKALKDLFKD